jgi:subtilase family serine protease
VASCSDQNEPGYLIALQNYLNENITGQIMSISYGICERTLGISGNSVVNATYQQAAAQGFSVFAATGDGGPAGCDWDIYNYAVNGIAVSGYASSPYVVAVGGTNFADWVLDPYGSTNTYWYAQNGQNGYKYGSAISYIPEMVWNASCGNLALAMYYGYKRTYGQGEFCNVNFENGTFITLDAGSGGPSSCALPAPSGSGCVGYPKPHWQNGILGNPVDVVRDVPDVSILSSGTEWGHQFAYCQNENGNFSCPSTWSLSGGTSFSAPIFAGIQAVIDQNIGEQVGNPNQVYYAIAKAEYGAQGNSNCLSTQATAGNNCAFYDVSDVKAHMDSTNVVPCEGNDAPDCLFDGETIGVLSTSTTTYQPAYASQQGWDFTTGIGTPNVTNLIDAWPVP